MCDVRYINSVCGYSAKGTPRDVEFRYKLHKKHCTECRDKKIEIPQFNRENALLNGFNGIRISKHGNPIKTPFITHTVVDDLNEFH